MAETSRRVPRIARARGLAWVALALVALLLVPVGAIAVPAREPVVTVAPEAASGGIVATVTWNGANIATANTSSSAFSLAPGGQAQVVYNWSQPVLSLAPWLVDDARLQIFYLGIAVGTRDIYLTNGGSSGTVDMSNWTYGPLQYLLEGTFLLTASLLAKNGTTAWSESFWVDITAPFYLLAAMPIILLLIAIYEIYALCVSGKNARPPKAAATPPSTPGGGAAASTPPSETSPPAESATPESAPEPSPPSAGGTS